MSENRSKKKNEKSKAKGEGDPRIEDEAEGDEAKVDEAKVDEAEGDEAKGDEAKVDEAEVDEAKVDEAEGDEAPPIAAAEAAPEPEDPNEVPVPASQLARIRMNKTDWRHSLAVLLICGGIFLPQMGNYGMFDPWETHYTEVARQFMVRNNWMETFWHNGRGPEGFAETNFWSKPVGSFWMSGLSLKIFGYSGETTGKEIATGNPEWAVRLPFFLCGLFGIFCVYLMVARLFSRRAGILAAVVMATAPMYFMITRQAMTDMPYVGLITGGIALFMMAVFGHRDEIPVKRFKLGPWNVSWPHHVSSYLFLLAFGTFMTLQLNAVTSALIRVPLRIQLGGQPLSAAIGMAVYALPLLLFLYMFRKTRTKNEIYLYTFFMVVGIAGLAKGLIGALQPGLIILVYLLTSREWRLLADVALARGLTVAICVFFPWNHGMLARFGRSFWNELYGTEQLRRLTIGEQAQAKGTFEYYVSQMGYGLLPWFGFLPPALVRAFSLPTTERSPRDRVRLFAVVWLASVVALFTLTLTKYHHYILPAMAPAAILIAVYLDDLLKRQLGGAWLGILTAAGVLAITAFDMVKEPARWVWMYTYLYDRNWARGIPEDASTLIFWYVLIFGAALLLLFAPKIRKYALWGMVAVAVVFGGYLLNWYQVSVAPNWSQKGAISSYYNLRKGPEEELVAWQFNWRGETWYTGAEVVVSKSLDNKAIIAYLKERPNRRFFFITERSRFPSLRNMLPSDRGRKTLKIVDDSNVHYVLAAAHL
jgi:4-amino-4-deoxy-L-arabinose transferase-like glycosyltransferase